jgi:hypothetical protein
MRVHTLISAFILLLGSSLLSSHAATAPNSPIYVGENLTKENMLLINFLDVPTKAHAGLGEGNIAAFKFELQRAWRETGGFSATVPVYTATRSATGLKQDANFGNLSAGIGLSQRVSDVLSDFDFGYIAQARVYAPTARQLEALSISNASPTTEFYQYFPSATALNPQLGLYVQHTYWSAKTAVGYGFQYISRESIAQGKKARHSGTWQTAATVHIAPWFDLNGEYNAIYLDTQTASHRARYRHSISPSGVVRLGPVAASVYLTVPLDNPTTEITGLAVGAKAGFVF